jgi:hypothetical protein
MTSGNLNLHNVLQLRFTFLQTHQRAATPVSTVEFIEDSSTQALIRRAWMNSVNRIAPTPSRNDNPVANNDCDSIIGLG